MKGDRSRTPAEIWMFEDGTATPFPDELATEEPLEIRLRTAQGLRPVAVTMRTPGADRELAAGFLYGEGVIGGADDLVRFEETESRATGAQGTVLTVTLAPGLEPDLATLDRHFYTTSACGVCGKGSLDALLLGKNPVLPPGPTLSPALLQALPDRLRSAQGTFQATGGLHAAALFDSRGGLIAAREDVGRHNALDKLVGWCLLEGRLPLHDHLVMVSGRTSYEILQKCVMAEVPVLCAVSAPSSLAVATARRFGMTLVGFLRGNRFNVYSGAARIDGLATAGVRA